MLGYIQVSVQHVLEAVCELVSGSSVCFGYIQISIQHVLEAMCEPVRGSSLCFGLYSDQCTACVRGSV